MLDRDIEFSIERNRQKKYQSKNLLWYLFLGGKYYDARNIR